MLVSAIVILAIIGFAVFFTALWCGVCLLLSVLGGWRSLARRYRATVAATGTRHRGVSARIGSVNYKNALTVTHSAEGFHLAVFALLKFGHPDLFIPWSAVLAREDVEFLWTRATRLSIGDITVTLARELAVPSA